ncbi:PD-(D/E)XK motif protein [Glutamicibacter arilaitensis]|uniref:PD-(D/E)XK motif protein n=1 Tax=Glutamicibacter arilaitensis TaxID=256701 RepID=UPI003F9EB126
MRSREYFLELSDAHSLLNKNEADVKTIRDREEPHRAWVGFDQNSNAVAYFEAPSESVRSFSVSKVIDVTATQVAVDSTGEDVDCIKIICRESRLNEVFYVFVDELLERLLGEANPSAVLQESASDWRRLLQLATSGFSINFASGLYGELIFLEQSVKAVGPIALENWQRSEFDIHDFVSTGSRVEVKTSKFQTESAVSIHGLKQLAVPMTATLTLAVAEIDNNSGEQIDDAIRRILVLGVDREQLVGKLEKVGYVIGMPDAQNFRFSIVSWRFWEITAESPVLSSTSLAQVTADAISSVNYKLHLAALGPADTHFDFARLTLGD